MTNDFAQLDFQVATDYMRVRWKAFLHDIAAVIAGRPRDLIPFEEVREKLCIYDQRDIGLQSVPVKKIVGSVDRYRDFDRSFLPTQSHTEDRWKGIDLAHLRHVELPPVKLYKVGDVYFVRDGHHRVSVAREKGAEFIDAEVIESRARVPITPDLTAGDLEIAGEYVTFLERTGLDRLRPDQRIEFSEPGGYEDLWEHILVHRYYLGLEHQQEISQDEAVKSWYDTLYLPVVEVIRRRHILADFPGRTEADLYLWIMDHRHYLHERYGRDVGAEAASEDFAEQFSRRLVKRVARRMRRTSHALAPTEDRAEAKEAKEEE
jgi:hypothetical protein